ACRNVGRDGYLGSGRLPTVGVGDGADTITGVEDLVLVPVEEHRDVVVVVAIGVAGNRERVGLPGDNFSRGRVGEVLESRTAIDRAAAGVVDACELDVADGFHGVEHIDPGRAVRVERGGRHLDGIWPVRVGGIVHHRQVIGA